MKRFTKLTLMLAPLTISGALGVIIASSNDVKEADAYNRTTPLPTTIDLNDTSAANIRSYYSSLNPLSTSERQGTNLLKNLKTILMNGQKYYSYDTGGEDIWKIYEIIDRDWELSPASNISGYNANTNKITGYTYNTSNPYIHALYVNRDVENQTTAWDDHQQTQWGINREHIWPKSQGFNANGAGGARGDPMHLWAGNGRVNGTEHNNYPYGFVNTSKIKSDPVKSGYNNLSGNIRGTSLTLGSGDVFEPQDCDKGDIARALFYMAARYNYLSVSDSDGIDTNNPNLELVNEYARDSSFTSSTTETGKSGLLKDLLAWNRLDPPDEWEIHRNNLLYNNYTNNRNPFIDYPEWAEYIWGSVTLANDDRTITSYSSTATGYATPSSDTLNNFNGAVEASVSISSSVATLTVGNTTTLSATSSDSSLITWTTSNSGAVSLSSNSSSSGASITLTGVSAGSATITARATIGGNNYTKTCSVTVSSGEEEEEKGTMDNPYTVSEAWDIINGLSSGQNNGQVVYVTGTVTSDTINYNSTYNRSTFNITDGSKTIKAYSISEASTDPESDYYIAADYTVIVGGALINYNSTYEVGYTDGYQSSIVLSTAPVGSIEISSDSASLMVEGTQTINATTSNGSNVTWTTSNSSIVSISSNSSASGNNITITGVAVGSATITASATIYNKVYEATCSVTVRSSNAEYELYTSALTEGNYLITYQNKAVSGTISSNRATYLTVSPSNNIVTNPSSSIIWHIEQSGNYWTIYNESAEQYLAATGAKNQVQLIDENDGNDSALWSCTKTNNVFDFVSKRNDAAGVNKTLRCNNDYGFACYSTSTGGSLTLYKQVVPTVTSVEVDPTSIEVDLSTIKTATLSATVLGTNDPSQVVTWTSSNTNVATVSSSGVVTGVSTGVATITATSVLDGTKSASCTVTVINSITPVQTSALSKVFADEGYSNEQAITTVTFYDSDPDTITATFDKGTNNNYSPKYYNTGNAIRCYGGNTFTITSSKSNLISISLTFASGEGSNEITTNVGTYSNGTWTGNTNEVVFTIGGTSGQRRIASITISYFGAGEYAAYFVSNTGCDGVGNTAPAGNWTELSNKYQTLFTADQNTLKNASANIGGTGIEQAMARYDLIVRKYGTSSYSNFISRNVASANYNLRAITNDSDMTLLILVFGLLTVSSLGLLIFKRKKDR